MKMIWKLRLAAAVAMLALGSAPAASANQLVEFESASAVPANGTIPPVPSHPLEEAKEVCGSETTAWGSELLTTAPKEIKVKNEWGDIVPGKEVMISGTVHNVVSPGDADIPIDHPFSADTTFDVTLDEPYWNLARELTSESEGHASHHEIHLELETGAFPHVLPQGEGPAAGEPWGLLESEITEREAHFESTATLLQDASLGLESAYIPHNGDRIAAKGRWIIDCGHLDFHAELHPITFMAFGHAVGSQTVVHVLANPYRVTQLYGFGTGGVNPPKRKPSLPKGTPFPEAFEQSVTTLATNSFSGKTSPLFLLGGIERTGPTAAPFKVCAPESGPGKLQASYGFVTRTGVRVKAKPDRGRDCLRVSTVMGVKHYAALQPRTRTCAMPWPWLSSGIATALGVGGVRSNEVETITVNATGGTFTITYAAKTTAKIVYNASATEVQGALEAFLKPGEVTVTGGPGGAGGGTPYTLTFGGELAETAITPVTTDRSGLTGGAKLATVVVTKPGGLFDLRRFILSLIEQKAKVFFEEHGATFAKVEANMALTPETSCLDPLSAPPINLAIHHTISDSQPFPIYGQVQVEVTH
jgi:hypothetical protein